jgi:hypothetical protein
MIEHWIWGYNIFRQTHIGSFMAINVGMIALYNWIKTIDSSVDSNTHKDRPVTYQV